MCDNSNYVVQSSAIALFCYLAEDMVKRTGCVNAVFSELIREAKLKFSSYPDAVNNIATIESSVPTKATLIITQVVVHC